VHLALGHEIERQRVALAADEAITQETRGWNEAKGVTVSQRSKEYAHDYRYFPEPDLPPMNISREHVESIRGELPELPAARAARLRDQLGLSAYDADQLTASMELADYFEAVVEGAGKENAKEAANWVVGEVNRALAPKAGSPIQGGLKSRIIAPPRGPITLDKLMMRPSGLAALIRRKLDGSISNNQAKDVFQSLAWGPETVDSAASVDAAIEARGMRQVSDAGELETWVDAAIAAQPQAASDVRAGNERAIGRLVGEVMKLSGGKANGPAVSALLKEKLKS
jgi:aspartyl-tRNA(Asn)/glutamyl-tRNA(Gln) amidotransferase subunit B